MEEDTQTLKKERKREEKEYIFPLLQGPIRLAGLRRRVCAGARAFARRPTYLFTYLPASSLV